MKTDDLKFLLAEVHALAFMNPFAKERDDREGKIIAKFGWTDSLNEVSSTFTKEFNQVLYWVTVGERNLIEGKAKDFRSVLGAEHMASMAYFSLYHELVGELDQLIDSGVHDMALNRKLFRLIKEGINQRGSLVGGERSSLWGNPEHLFACFYQLRRAYLQLYREIAGSSDPMRDLRVRVWESVFTQDMLSYQQWMHQTVGRFPTLVLGPSGSGKEIVARALGLSRFIPYDSKSNRFASNPKESFRPVNLSALSETLIESELFGHRQGSFTGAIRDHAGIFETAGSFGTVFLDEIGEVPKSIQVKLLRLLQSGEFQSIGGVDRSSFEGKIIAATHRDLGVEMKNGRIREDFFYRLCGDQINTVALQDILSSKPDEIISSVGYICEKLFGAEGAKALSSKVVEQLNRQVPRNYSWPGNFRELEQAVRNIIVRNEYTPIENQTVHPEITKIYQESQVTLNEWNKLYAQRAFKNSGSYRAAAHLLQVDQRTLKKLVNKKTIY